MEQNRMSTHHKERQHKSPEGNKHAELDGKTGKFETEKLKKTDVSAIPGAEDNTDIGTAASGAGLGGNKGTGTNNK